MSWSKPLAVDIDPGRTASVGLVPQRYSEDDDEGPVYSSIDGSVVVARVLDESAARELAEDLRQFFVRIGHEANVVEAWH